MYEHQWYKPLFSKVTLALKGEIDYGHGIGNTCIPCSRTSTAAVSVPCAAT
jgi:hypothetical protein